MRRHTGEAVADHYDLGTPAGAPTYADRGELGRIWRLDTDRGSWAVKEAIHPVPEAAAAADVAFQLAVAAAGVPLPRPVRAPDGTVLLDGAAAGSAAGTLRVYAWAELVPDALVTGAELGAVAALVHRTGHPAAGPVSDWFAEPLGAAAWHDLDAAARAAGAWWSEPLTRWLPGLVALDDVVTPNLPERTITCHLDLNVENVRRGPDGSVVVLDWENSGPAQPERELAAMLTDLAVDLGTAEAIAAYAAYRAAGGPAELTGPADFATAIAVQGKLLRFYGQRALSDPDPENRERSERRLKTMLGRPLTPDHVTALLTALR